MTNLLVHYHKILLMPMALSSCMAAVLATPSAARSETKFTAVHGASESQYVAWFNTSKANGFRPVFISALGNGDGVRFAAIGVNDGKDWAWHATHGQTPEDHQRTVNELSGQGYRMTSFCGYLAAGSQRFATVWVKDGTREKWVARSGLNASRYVEVFREQTAAGLRPVQVVGYPTGDGSYAIGAIFVESGGVDWAAHHDVTAAQLQQIIDENAPKGFRPISVSAYTASNESRFAIVLIKDSAAWRVRHKLTSHEYQEQFDAQAKDGYRLICVSAYHERGQLLYAGVWVKDV